MYEWKENDYALYQWKRKTKSRNGKENKSITEQFYHVVWQIQEVKSTKDALEKQGIFAYDNAEDSGSDMHAPVAHFF